MPQQSDLSWLSAGPQLNTEALLRETAELALDYWRRLPSTRVAPSPAAVARIADLGGAVPARGQSASEVIARLADVGSSAATGSAGGRYFGFVTGGSLPVTVAANWLAAIWDQNAATSATSPFGAGIEEIVLPWVADLLGLPAAGGALVTGASVATFTALAAARHHLLMRHGWNVQQDGLAGAPKLKIVVSDEVHVTVLKALSLLGFGTKGVMRVAVDDQGRMRLESLPNLDESSIVCVQAGNVNSGSFDPIGDICERAEKVGAWVHVDGAFGLWAAASSRYAPLTSGVELANSWATDAHKWLNVPYDCGIALVRDEADLMAAMSLNAAYLVPAGRRDPCNFGPELSRRARGIELWAAISALGRIGIADLVEQSCAHASRLAAQLQEAGIEVLNDVVLNQILVAFGEAESTRAVIERLQAGGDCWCGGTVWQGRTAMRISISGWATTPHDIDHTFQAIVRAAQGGAANS